MSLTAFHVVFISLSAIVTGGFGIWGIYDYFQTGNGVNLALGLGSLVVAVVLVRYTPWFLRKMRAVEEQGNVPPGPAA